MSRPQYAQIAQPMPVLHGMVNNGLIDFQDNTQRGAVEYLTPMQIQAYAQPLQAQAYAQPLQAQAYTQPQQGKECISGPPTYVQINGVKYRPMEEAVVEDKRLMSEQELEQAIDERVESRVKEYLSCQHKTRHARAAPVATKEELAARKVASINQSMSQFRRAIK